METEMWAQQREKNREKERRRDLISTNYTPKKGMIHIQVGWRGTV